MTNLRDVFSLKLFDQMVSEGYVRVGHHDTEPYVILNYTEKAQFGKVWNEVTRQCRGLIVNNETWEIIARPFPKFFNWGDPDVGSFDMDARVVVTDKMDGSLGIQYQLTDGSWAIATRGSFHSEQAVEATRMLQLYIAEGYNPSYYNAGQTDLFEIIYPENRIVVDYGQEKKLVWLGCVDIEEGIVRKFWYDVPVTWSGDVAESMKVHTLREALELPPRPNAEGMVVFDPATNKQVKIKQEDYLRLHKIVTGLNARAVWEAMKDDKFDELMESLPDEFHEWTLSVRNALDFNVTQTVARIYGVWQDVSALQWDRKAFALKVIADHPSFQKYMFALLDRRDIMGLVWAENKPGPNWTPRNTVEGEDTA